MGDWAVNGDWATNGDWADVGGAPSVVHTTDALVIATLTRDHTTDALVLAEVSLAHTTDAFIVQAGTFVAHTTDALVLATRTQDHDTDALLRAQGVITHTTDALLVAPLFHTTDAFIRQDVELVVTVSIDISASIGPLDPPAPPELESQGPPGAVPSNAVDVNGNAVVVRAEYRTKGYRKSARIVEY